jgi:hypothetical protein
MTMESHDLRYLEEVQDIADRVSEDLADYILQGGFWEMATHFSKECGYEALALIEKVTEIDNELCNSLNAEIEDPSYCDEFGLAKLPLYASPRLDAEEIGYMAFFFAVGLLWVEKGALRCNSELLDLVG